MNTRAAVSEADGSEPQLTQRLLMTYFPTGVSVVTALDAGGRPYGTTCSSLTSVCLEPPTVLVSLTTRSATLRHALEQGIFGITLLNVESQAVAQRFATPEIDRFTDVNWRLSPLGAPWLDAGMTAAADCEVQHSLEAGDHTVVFGRIRNVEVAGGVPLLYGLRSYKNW